MSQPESRLSRAIKAAIRARGGYCIKIHGGPTMEAGTPDILACIPVALPYPDDSPHAGEHIISGIFVGIETKMPDGGDPTPIQNHRHDQIRKAGGVVIVARSVQQVVQALKAMGMVNTRDEPVSDD